MFLPPKKIWLIPSDDGSVVVHGLRSAQYRLKGFTGRDLHELAQHECDVARVDYSKYTWVRLHGPGGLCLEGTWQVQLVPLQEIQDVMHMRVSATAQAAERVWRLVNSGPVHKNSVGPVGDAIKEIVNNGYVQAVTDTGLRITSFDDLLMPRADHAVTLSWDDITKAAYGSIKTQAELFGRIAAGAKGAWLNYVSRVIPDPMSNGNFIKWLSVALAIGGLQIASPAGPVSFVMEGVTINCTPPLEIFRLRPDRAQIAWRRWRRGDRAPTEILGIEDDEAYQAAKVAFEANT